MLVLSRKVGEAIRIADDIELVVLGIKDVRVRIGVEAHRSVPVIREEDKKQNPSDRIIDKRKQGYPAIS